VGGRIEEPGKREVRRKEEEERNATQTAKEGRNRKEANGNRVRRDVSREKKKKNIVNKQKDT